MKLLALFCTLLALVASHKSYHGHKVLRTGRLSVSQTELLRAYHVTSNLDFWREAGPAGADLMVPDHLLDSVTAWLESHDISHSVMVEDVEELIQLSRPSNGTARGMFDWTDYYPHADLNMFIQGLADTNEWASIIDIGKSYEGRDMKVLALTKAGPGKPNIWLEAGIHAREWISPAVATFIVNKLVQDYSEHPDYLDNINWYFLPSANPDGYQYCFDTDRLWRKTRSPQGECYGVDPNRNWDFHWAETGVSHNPCYETFCGPEPFSEPEMANIRDFVKTLDPIPVLSHTFHSYSQLWLWPYGYDYNAYPDNYEEIRDLAVAACDALAMVHDPAAGASDDWYKGALGSRFAYTTELRDTGFYGFVLPPEQIIPSGEEMWAAFEVVIAKMLSL